MGASQKYIGFPREEVEGGGGATQYL